MPKRARRVIFIDEVTVLIEEAKRLYLEATGRVLTSTEVENRTKDVARRTKRPEKETRVPKQTAGQWLNYQAFPSFDSFERFLAIYDDPDHQQLLREYYAVACTACENQGVRVGAALDVPRWPHASLFNRLAAAAAAAFTAWAVGVIGGNSPSDARQAAVTTGLRCARVTESVSPVYERAGGGRIIKTKASPDRVRLLNQPEITVDGRRYMPVLLPDPRDSSTGIGWMRASDLTPTDCNGLGK